MVDRGARDALALYLRRLISGRMTSADYVFEADRLLRSRDPSIRPIVEAAYWTFGNFGPRRYIGESRVDRETRRHVARVVLFLRSELEYEWPPDPAWAVLRDILWVVTLGGVTSGQESWARWRRSGQFSMWPFMNQSDFESVAGQPAFRMAPRARAG